MEKFKTRITSKCLLKTLDIKLLSKKITENIVYFHKKFSSLINDYQSNGQIN